MTHRESHIGMRRYGRVALRTALVAVATALTVLVGATAAQAATTQRIIRDSSYNIVAEAWFNSGTHNLSKGRNSFTVKDYGSCNPAAFVEWWGARNGYYYVGCGESSFSIEPNNVARAAIAWRICLMNTNNFTLVTCTSPVSDSID